MKLDFPISLDTGIGLSASWTTDVLSEANILPSYNPAIITRSTLLADAALNIYFVKFLDSSNNPIQLEADEAYMLRVVASAPHVTATTGAVDIVRVYATSSNQENHIILNANPAFAPLYFTDHPIATATITVIGGSILAGRTEPVTVSYTPSVALTENAKVVIMLGSDKFSIAGSTCSQTLTLPFRDCYLETPQKVIFTGYPTLTAGTAVSFTLDITGALEGSQTSSMTLYSVQDYYSDIQETGTLANALSSTQHVWATTNYAATFSWGFSTELNAAVPDCIKLYTNGPTQTVYNTIRFSFTVGSNLPDSNYRLRVNLAGAQSVLETSIIENFPAYGGTGKVVCRGGTAEVTCTNIDTPVLGTTYFIALKVSLTGVALNANFGNIELYATDPNTGTYATTSILFPRRATFTIPTTQNRDKQVIGQTPLSSWAPGETPDPTRPGVKTGQVNNFEFRVNTAINDFDGSGTFTNNFAGLEIFTNGNIISLTGNPSTCGSTAGGVNVGNLQVCTSTSLTPASIPVVRFRVGWTAPANTNAFGTGTNPFTITYNTNYPVVVPGTYIADDTTLDLFFNACANNLNSAGNFIPGCTSSYLLNAYTISRTNTFLASDNFNIFISNFWTSTSTDSLTGNEFPAIIQLKGAFAAGDYNANTEKLVLFFTNLQPFGEEDFSSSNKVACSGTVGVECYYYPGSSSVNNPLFYNRIDIFPTAGFNTNPLQIIIPVSTVVNQLSISAVLGLAQEYSPPLDSKTNLGRLQESKIFSFTFSAPASNQLYAVDHTNVNNVDYYLQTTSKRVGETSTATISTNHNDATGIAFTPNTALLRSSLFTWTTKYHFYPNRNAGNAPTANFATSGSCIFFDYYYGSDTRYPRRYGITCPVDANLNMPQTPAPAISIPEFVFPSVEGINMPESFGTLCTNQGVLLEFQRDVRTAALSPNIITSVRFNPVLQQGEKGSIATVEFNTTNIIPQNSVIRISTSTVPLQFSAKEGTYCALYQDSIPDLQTTLLPGNCYQNSEAYEMLFIITNPVPWTSRRYFLRIYEINITNFIQVSSQDYNISTLTQQYFTIDLATSATSVVNPVYFLTQVRASDITLGNTITLSDAYNTRSQLLVTVTTSAIKPLTRFGEIRIQFWTITQALDENFVCEIIDENSKTSLIFQYCRVDPPYVGLRPYYDILVPQTFTVRLKSINNPVSASTIRFYQWDLEGNFVVNSTNSLTFPTNFTMPQRFNRFVLEKRFNYITMYAEFIFTLDLPISLDKNSALLFRFPSGYSAADITEPLLCIIDNLESNCYLSNPQEVTITDLPLSQPANQIFRVFILGLRQPYLTKAFNISLQISTKDNLYTPLAYQEIADILPEGTTTLSPIHVTSVSLGSTYSLNNPDLTIGFTIDPPVATLNDRSLILDFPNLYGLVLHNRTLDFTLSQGGTEIMHEDVTFRLFRLEIPLTSSISTDTAYTIVIREIPNPFLEIFSHPLMSLSITGATTYELGYQAYRALINTPGPTGYTFDPTKHNLEFFQINNGIAIPMTYTSNFQVYSGLPTLEFEMRITEPVRYDRTIIMDPSPQNTIPFTSTPDVLNVTCGTIGYRYSLTLPFGIAPGHYAIKFNKIETDPATDLATDFYSAIPPLLVQLISQRNVIQLPTFTANTLSLAENGYSFPITFDLSRIKPPNSLTIVAYIPPTSDMNIQFQEYTEITLTSTSPVGAFTLVHTGGGIPGVSRTTISFYLDGPDKDLYGIEQREINIALMNLPQVLPTLSVDFHTATLNTTGFDLNITCDQVTEVYYEIVGHYGTPIGYWQTTTQTNLNDRLSYVREMVRLRRFYAQDEFQRKDQFFGVWFYQTINVSQAFSFNGLRNNVQYTLKIWAVNLQGNASTTYQNTFTTAFNNGAISVLTLTFDSILENRQLNKLACFLMVRNRLPYANVKDFLGYSCNDNRTHSPTVVDNILSSQNRIINIRNTNTYSYRFYIYPLSFLTNDDVAANILNDVDPGNNSLSTDINAFISSWPFSIPVMTDDPTATTVTTTTDVNFMDDANQIQDEFVISSTNISISLNNLRLNQPGFIWVYALRKNNYTSGFDDLFIPGKGDFKYYLNRRLLDQNYVALKYFDGTNPVDILFDGLDPNEDYILHWFGQNDDAGHNNRTTFTRSAFVSTKESMIMNVSKVLFALFIFIGLAL